MATVTSSSYVASTAQVDGRRWIRQLVNISTGRTVIRDYLAAVGHDAQAALTALLDHVLDDLAAEEVAANVAAVSVLGSQFSPTLVYSTPAANVAAAREAFKSSSQEFAVMIADYFNNRTDVQNQSAFGITAQQAANLRTNTLAPAAITAAAIRAAVGQ